MFNFNKVKRRVKRALSIGQSISLDDEPLSVPDDSDNYRDYLEPGKAMCAGKHAGRCGPDAWDTRRRVMTESRNWDRSPETPADTRFHDLRAEGWRGPVDQDGYLVVDVDDWIRDQMIYREFGGAT